MPGLYVHHYVGVRDSDRSAAIDIRLVSPSDRAHRQSAQQLFHCFRTKPFDLRFIIRLSTATSNYAFCNNRMKYSEFSRFSHADIATRIWCEATVNKYASVKHSSCVLLTDGRGMP